jgi:hypothetical protein
VLTAIGEDHVGSFAGQTQGDVLADAPATPGNQAILFVVIGLIFEVN